MIILQKYRLLERLIGLDAHVGWERIFVRIVYLVSFISFNLMELIFIILNIHDGIDQAIPALAPISGAFPLLACYGHLLINRDRYYYLMNEMQDIVNGSACLCFRHMLKKKLTFTINDFSGVAKGGTGMIYTNAEQRITAATKIALCIQFLVPITSSSPFLLVTYHWCMGIYTIDSWFFWFPVW